MKTSLTLYQVCNSENGGPFNPVGGVMTMSKHEALAELCETHTFDPKAYLAEITYTRVPEAQKGR